MDTSKVPIRSTFIILFRVELKQSKSSINDIIDLTRSRWCFFFFFIKVVVKNITIYRHINHINGWVYKIIVYNSGYNNHKKPNGSNNFIVSTITEGRKDFKAFKNILFQKVKRLDLLRDNAGQRNESRTRLMRRAENDIPILSIHVRESV